MIFPFSDTINPTDLHCMGLSEAQIIFQMATSIPTRDISDVTEVTSIASPDVQVGITVPTANSNLNSNANDVHDIASTPRSIPSISESLFEEPLPSSDDSSDSDSNTPSDFKNRLKKGSVANDFVNSGPSQTRIPN